jgi:hypothetical protein
MVFLEYTIVRQIQKHNSLLNYLLLFKNLFKIPLLFQCLSNFFSLIVSVLICPLSYVTVRRAPEKTRSSLLLISEIERILIAISASLGQRCF